MKIQTKTIWQKQLVFAAIATVVFMFAASSLAFAQANYKVGDKIEVLENGKAWFKAEIFEVKDGSYRIGFDGYDRAWDQWVKSDRMRPIGANQQAKDRNKETNGNNQVQNQTNKTNQTKNQTVEQPPQANKFNKYGSRDPRICDNTVAPKRGAITSSLAKQYFICQAERVSGAYLYLVENEKVEVVGGRAFQPQSDVNYSEIDVRIPIYPIRGSYTGYTCLEVHSTPGETLYNVGKNCIVQEYRKATGSCYKTTFGDWRCSMTNGPINNDDFRSAVPPPK